MFYGQFILAKKGPLAKVWLAAHLERKLSRQMVFDTDVDAVINEVLRPKVTISLRTNGHLMLGIVRIYSKKAEFILHDLERARKLFYHFVEKERRQVHRVRNVGEAQASAAIPEEDEQEMEIEIPNMNDFAFPPGPEFNARMHNVDITLNETDNFLGHNDMTYLDEIFDPEANENFDDLLDDNLEQLRLSRAGTEERIFDSSDLEAPRRSHSVDGNQIVLPTEAARDKTSDEKSRIVNATRLRDSNQAFQEFDEPMDMEPVVVPFDIIGEPELENSTSVPTISLDPLSESQIRQNLAEDRQTRRRQRVKFVIADENISLDDEEIRNRMENIGDIVNPISYAPPTKELMNAKLFGSVNYIFNNPATNMYINPTFMKLYSEHCVAKSRPLSDVPTAEEIRESLGMSQEAQLDANERVLSRNSHRSRASSAARSFMFDQQQNQDEMLLAPQNIDDAFVMNDSLVDTALLIQNNFTNQPFNLNNDTDASFAPTQEEFLDMAFEEQPMEDDRENINPFAGPPSKRSRTEPEVRAEEERRQRSTKALMRLIKAEATKIGKQTIEFNEIVIPKTINKKAIRQLPQESRIELSKKASHQFYALLELRKTRTIEVDQKGAYQPIFVTILS